MDPRVADVCLSSPAAPAASTAAVAGTRLGAAWGVGNKLIAFPTQDRKLPVKNVGTLMHEVTWETTLYQPVFRKLVNESWQTFRALQKASRDEEASSGGGYLLRFSRQYRSIVRDCQEQLDSMQDFDPTAEQHSELLYKLELVWNLMEILFVEKQTIGIVLPQLLQWISLHFPQADEKVKSILEECPEQPETHADYWNALTIFLMQGRKDQALNLLRLHSEYGLSGGSDGGAVDDAFASLDELIRKMPTYAGPSQSSAIDFDFRWRHWQREVVTRIDEGDFASFPDRLGRLARLLAGSEQALADLVPLCETWYQWMCARLLYQRPDVKSYDLPFHAQQAVARFGGLGGMTALDSVILAAMEGDLAQVMHELVTTLDNFWFPAHLLDLLHHANQLDNPGHYQDRQQEDDASAGGIGGLMRPSPGLREFLLLEFATCLMSHRSLWQVGALYLDHCPTQGRQRLECLLERMPLQSEKKANKVIAMASERGMVGVVSSACKVMGMRALKSDRIGTAMGWALRSQDVQFTTFLADQLLGAYCKSGEFTSSDLLDHLGQSMVVSDRLTFLAKYREFHKLCEQGDFRSAATLLHSLMWSRLAPKYFWVTLLIDALPFISLGGDDVLLGSEQTHEIMHCLQELSKDPTLPRKQRLQLETHEPQIRKHLARNLALALMEEGDESCASGVLS